MSENGYVVFVWKTSGYELEEREGEPPAIGEQVDDGLVVTKVGASPLPGDRRRCVFTSGR
ncbi:MAG TPA: hypothetical protein VIU44_03175 [Gaiellaceae bacterium]|jgi:hypothetical protein